MTPNNANVVRQNLSLSATEYQFCVGDSHCYQQDRHTRILVVLLNYQWRKQGERSSEPLTHWGTGISRLIGIWIIRTSREFKVLWKSHSHLSVLICPLIPNSLHSKKISWCYFFDFELLYCGFKQIRTRAHNGHTSAVRAQNPGSAPRVQPTCIYLRPNSCAVIFSMFGSVQRHQSNARKQVSKHRVDVMTNI